VSTPNDTVLTIDKVAGGVLVGWSGGFPPYQLQRCDKLGNPLENIGAPTLAMSSIQPNASEEGYFRVWQSVPLLDIDLTQPGVVLIWQIPERGSGSTSNPQPPPFPS
jgi:hypothetical protein